MNQLIKYQVGRSRDELPHNRERNSPIDDVEDAVMTPRLTFNNSSGY